MPRFFNIAVGALLVLFVFTLNAHGNQTGAKNEDTAKIIDYLIEEVGVSHLTFVRNGEKHTSDEAVQHIQMKYNYFKSRIESPEDFIRLCASKSLFSGKPYLVITPEGNITVEKWLEQILADYRKSRASWDTRYNEQEISH